MGRYGRVNLAERAIVRGDAEADADGALITHVGGACAGPRGLDIVYAAGDTGVAGVNKDSNADVDNLCEEGVRSLAGGVCLDLGLE
jgi:hypothetical protein